jgi:hypothetical protein
MAYFTRRRRGVRHQWLIGFAIIALATWVAWQTPGTRSRDQAPAPQLSPQDQAMSDHCAVYVALAKTNFGAEWKARLPAGGPCASAIEQAWAHEQAAATTAIAPQPVAPALLTPQPTTPSLLEPPASATPESAGAANFAATPADSAPKRKTESPGGRDTYCLNVVYLARSKFGDDWKSHLTPGQAAKCAAYGR